ncbi:MAG: tetratricopeptide (TPR) repeat protein [Gammaproteobacteria bacterium]|jgi:tetratricopeptide (TPR) repeat protein
MKALLHHKCLIILFLLISCLPAQAEVNGEIKQLQQEWAQIKYTLDKKEHEVALEKLATKAAAIRETQLANADVHLWEGIILSTYAGAIGSLRALEAVEQSRSALELSIKIDPNASNGAAHTYLGTLYYLVPEWPIAFGDFEIAKEYLEKAIELNPDDIDANYFYADFLRKQKKYADAEIAFNKANNAPARPGRELADEGRRKEAKEGLEDIKDKL